MAINWTTLFNRIGRGLFVLDLLDEFRGAAGSAAIATDLPTEWEDFVETYDATPDNYRAIVDTLPDALDAARNTLASLHTTITTALAQTIIETTNDNQPLAAKDTTRAIAELIAQMTIDAKTVDANTVTALVTMGGANSGNGAVVVSVKDGAGKTAEYTYNERVSAKCTSSATAGAERWALAGEAAAATTSHRWPDGSGAGKNLTSLSAPNSNKVTNGAFENFTSNTPDDWTVITGAAGAQIFQETTTIYAGAKSLRFLGDGATQTQIRQLITGLVAKTPYAVNLWGRVDSAPAAGVLSVELFDGTNVINDEAGIANALVISLPTIGTTFVAQNAVFRLPDPVPATVYLRLRLSTALTNTRNAYFDHLSLQAMTQLYTAGPWVAICSGAANWGGDDTFTIAMSNDYGGRLQTFFWRLFAMPTLSLMLPSNAAGAENILDSVIA